MEGVGIRNRLLLRAKLNLIVTVIEGITLRLPARIGAIDVTIGRAREGDRAHNMHKTGLHVHDTADLDDLMTGPPNYYIELRLTNISYRGSLIEPVTKDAGAVTGEFDLLQRHGRSILVEALVKDGLYLVTQGAAGDRQAKEKPFNVVIHLRA